MAKGTRKPVHSGRNYQDMKKYQAQEARRSQESTEKADMPGKKATVLITIFTVVIMLVSFFALLRWKAGLIGALLGCILVGFLGTLLLTVTVQRYNRAKRLEKK